MRDARIALTAVLMGALGMTSLGSAAMASTVPTAVTAVSGSGLTDNGQAAIADLRVCLASQPTLNVYYLVDSSLSLEVADSGGAGSDPDVVRASILGNSLEQLGAVSDDVSVNWAAGFFSSDYSAAVGWQAWNESSPDQLADTIRAKAPGGYTNWPAALSGAQQSLAKQQAAQPGCQLLVWLTDGQLDIQAPDGQQQEDFDALVQMCSANGVFNSFRQSGVVVIGALLAVDSASRSAAADMQSLVEGSANGTDAQCGEQPLPASYVHGAFVEASAPESLAQIFLQLSTQLEGGYPQPFNADGSFWIDEGVSRFRIVLAGDWVLSPPSESGMSSAASDEQQSWATATATDGATVIDVTTDKYSAGKWQLKASDARSLFLFSDLRIVFEDSNSVELSDGGSLDASIEASVVDSAGKAADLGVFGDADFSAWYLDASGQRAELSGARIEESTGKISIPLPTDLTLAQLAVTASIDPLLTRDHQLSLAPVTVETTITTVLPASFPRVKTGLPVVLSDLEGASGQATGTITFTGPTEGGEGTVCLPEDPTVSNDVRDGWRWSKDAALNADGCITVPANGEATVSITAENDTPADSLVQAVLPITFQTADGGTISQGVPLEFRSTHPVNAGAILLLTLALLLLGVLIPLIILWFVNWLTTRIDIPKSTERASFPVRVTAAGAQIHAPRQGSALSDAFQFRKPSDGERSITDPDLGVLRARVPWFPLRAPWYEVVAPSGSTLITARAGRTASASKDSQRRLRFAKLPLDRFWAVVVSDAELRRTSRGDDVNGTVVIYHRASGDDQSQHTLRLGEVEADGALADAVNRARAELQERDGKTAAKRGGTKSTAKAPTLNAAPSLPGRGSANSGRGGSDTPPPRPGSVGGAPPARSTPTAPPTSGSRPPGAPPSSSPPRRPSAPPPPRP